MIKGFDKRGDWKGLAEYGRDRGEMFNDVNWALAINALGRYKKEVRRGGSLLLQRFTF